MDFISHSTQIQIHGPLRGKENIAQFCTWMDFLLLKPLSFYGLLC